MLGLQNPNVCHSSCWGLIYGGISALARGFSHSVTLFESLNGLLDSFTFFVSQNYRVTGKLNHWLTSCKSAELASR